MNQVRKEIVTLLALAFCSIATSVLLFECKKSDNPTSMASAPAGSPGANEVWIQNTSFNPASITVALNTAVTWVNKDGVSHTVSSSSGEFDSGNMTPGTNYTHLFNAKGVFPYNCNIHSNMTGTVVVQ